MNIGFRLNVKLFCSALNDTLQVIGIKTLKRVRRDECKNKMHLYLNHRT